MNPQRKKIVLKAFKSIDKDGSGWIDLSDIKGTYNAAKHPDVIQGKKTEDQILQEFLETFETAHAMRNNDAPNHVVTKEEFEEYYNNISASIDDDQYFELMMNNAWKLTEESRRGMGTKGWSNQAGATKQGQNASNIFGRKPQQATAEPGVPQNATEEQLL